MNIQKISYVVPLIVALLVTHLALAADKEINNGELLMGVAPFMSPDKLSKRLAPLRNYLSDKLKLEVVIELTRNPKQLLERTAAGRYDFVFTGPNFALRAFDSGLYLPGAIPEKFTEFIIITDSSSTINSIEQLKGKSISVPPKKGTIAKILPNYLQMNGLSKEALPNIVYYPSHNAALLAVLNGDVDASFVPDFSYHSLLPVGASVKEISRTEPLPAISFIFAKRLPDNLREEIITTLVDLNKSDRGKVVLKKISFPPFRRYSYREFDNLRIYLGKDVPAKNNMR